MAQQGTERLFILVLSDSRALGDGIVTAIGSTHFIRTAPILDSTFPVGPWDLVLINTDSLRVYQDIAKVLDVSHPQALRVIVSWEAHSHPGFHSLQPGEIWQYIPESATRSQWGMLMERVVLERRLKAFRTASAARERFLLGTSHSAAMRTFRDDAVRLAAQYTRMVVICDEVDQEARDLSMGVQAYMPCDGGAPCYIDGSLPEASTLLLGDACNRIGILVRPKPFVLAHPFHLSDDLKATLLARMTEGFPCPIVFLLDAQDAKQLRRAREDLQWSLKRLSARVEIPSFHERPEEVPWHVQRMVRDPARITSEVMLALFNHPWKSLVELEGVLEHLVADGEMPSLPPPEPNPPFEIPTSVLESMVNMYRRSIYIAALQRTRGMVAKAARLLMIPERTLRRHMRELNIRKESFRPRAKTMQE